MDALGYYSMTLPMVDTWETPFPIVSSPEEDVMPVPGWGMNPMLAGPYWIAVGDASSPSPGVTMLTRYLIAPVLLGGVAYFASNKKWTFAAAGVLGGLMVGAMLEKKGGA
jgi:hypothetical protein